MHWLRELLAGSAPLRFFVIIGLGYLIGHIRIGRFSLGVAAVLFVGIAMGAIDPEHMALPPDIATLGLVLFMYALGIYAGPAFFAALGPRTWRLSILVAFALVLGAGVAAVISIKCGVSRELASGLYCGGLTNTPALAAAIDYLHHTAGGDAGAPNLTVGYSIAYPFGVIGVMLAMLATIRIFGIDVKREREQFEREAIPGGPVAHRNFEVTKTKPNGNLLEVDWIVEQTGATLTRRRHGEDVDLLLPESTLKIGDVVRVVGAKDAVEKAGELIGRASEEHIELHSGHIGYRRMVVSNPAIIGKRIRELELEETQHAIITRVRRGDVDIPSDPDLILQRGDRVRVVTYTNNMAAVTAYFGDSLRAVAETDYLSISLGMALGVMLGAIRMPIGHGNFIQLGAAGGVLVVSLFLGHLIRTGPITWVMPMESNMALRQFGLLMFLSVVGVNAGGKFLDTFLSEGPLLLAMGAIITVIPCWTILLIGRWVLKQNLLSLYGTMAGAQTQPACLAYGQELTGSDTPGIAYATVLPTAMIVKILAAQALIIFLPK